MPRKTDAAIDMDWTPLPFTGALRCAPTLLSGMSFRWSRVAETDDCFVGVLGSTTIELREEPSGGVSFRCRAKQRAEAAALLRSHLRLDEPAAADHHEWHTCKLSPAVKRFRQCASLLPGVRVLSILDPWECLVTFMGSANNNIKRNMQMVQSLAASFDSNRLSDDAYGGCHYSFPSVDEVMTLSEEYLWEVGWGYRAPRLYKLVREVAERGGEGWLHGLAQESDPILVRKALMSLTGVGRKVADCILLFGFGFDGVVPVDTHCYQLAQRYLLPSYLHNKAGLSAGVYDKVVEAWHHVFGEERAGHAFMVMFVAELSDFRKQMAQAECDAEALKEEEKKAKRKRVKVKVEEVVEPVTPPSKGKKRSRIKEVDVKAELKPKRVCRRKI